MRQNADLWKTFTILFSDESKMNEEFEDDGYTDFWCRDAVEDIFLYEESPRERADVGMYRQEKVSGIH